MRNVPDSCVRKTTDSISLTFYMQSYNFVQPSLNLENMMAIVTRMLYVRRLLRELRLPYKKQKSSFGKD